MSARSLGLPSRISVREQDVFPRVRDISYAPPLLATKFLCVSPRFPPPPLKGFLRTTGSFLHFYLRGVTFVGPFLFCRLVGCSEEALYDI